MIPKIIHYCWFGRGPMPDLALKCIESWHKFMPDWEYKLWNEDNFDVKTLPYTKEAYEAKKYAFVTDYVRLWALAEFGGVYLDTDVEVFKPFDDLVYRHAFAGFEGSKHLPVGTCVLASEASFPWIIEQRDYYIMRNFINDSGSFDMITNVEYISMKLRERGLVQNGEEQDIDGLHIFPVEYFCPRQTTGEYLRIGITYSDHLGMGTWTSKDLGWKRMIKRVLPACFWVKVVKLKRKLIG